MIPDLDPEKLKALQAVGWACTDWVEDEQTIATLLTNGPEMHLSVAPGWRGRALSRRRILGALTPVFDKFGYVATRVKHDRVEQQTFVTRVGFTKIWSDDTFVYYMLTALPYQRQKP